MGKAKDMGVINQGKGKIGGKNVQKIMLNTKMNKCKKKPSKGITLIRAHK
jgi:myo-inositol-hexaphosphate 3-phosphohydrolase